MTSPSSRSIEPQLRTIEDAADEYAAWVMSWWRSLSE